jgi:hypothetical protein
VLQVDLDRVANLVPQDPKEGPDHVDQVVPMVNQEMQVRRVSVVPLVPLEIQELLGKTALLDRTVTEVCLGIKDRLEHRERQELTDSQELRALQGQQEERAHRGQQDLQVK